MRGDPTTTVADLAPPVRWILRAAAVLVFLAGVQLYVFPLRTDSYFAWTIVSPMTAMFLGGSYWSAVGLELMGSRAPDWARARIAIPAVFVFTTATLGVTLLHIDLFHLESYYANSTRFVTFAWIAVYALVPVLMIVALLAQRRIGFDVPPPTGLPWLVRGTLIGLALSLSGLGVVMLVAPGVGADVWSWELTPLTARAIGAWLLGLGVAAGHAFLIDDREAIRPLAVTGLVFSVLQQWAILQWGGTGAISYSRSAYSTLLLVLLALSVWTLWSKYEGRRPPPSPELPEEDPDEWVLWPSRMDQHT